MARVRMVTRSINVTVVKAIVMDITTVTPSIQEFELTGATYTNETALKSLKDTLETETVKIVAVQELTAHEEMYGIPETEFIKVAHKLDPATRRELETE